MPRSRVLSLSPVLLLLAFAACSPLELAAEPPNLLVILLDDLGYGDLSSYGARDLRTPNIDALARRGMRFTNFYANCPVCSPTRAALLSGRYPEMVGIPGVVRTHARESWGYLSRDAILLPQVLKRTGYRSALIGKWHLGLEEPNRPYDRGFDFFHGFLGDMMDDYYDHRRHGNNYMRRNDETIDPEGHATDLFTRWARDYLRQRHQASGPSKQPFFLYLAYNAPHAPIQPPAAWLEKVRERAPDMPEKRARLVALIEHLDDGIGQVLKELKDAGLEESTLVVLTSDNGGQLDAGADNGPLRDGKQSVYEGGIKVAAIAAWPGRIPAGTVSDRVAITMDLFPTLLEAAGLEAHHAIDGRSFLPLLLGGNQDAPNRDLFFCRREGGARYGGKTIEAIRRGDWKLLQNSPWSPQELYNLRDDPREENDLSRSHREEFESLASALRAQIQLYGSVPWQRPEESRHDHDPLYARPVPLLQAHAHNDYHHPRPLYDALAHGFSSVEADIFLEDGELLVAHERSELRRERTLEALYLEPLRRLITENGGSVLRDGPRFTLHIDIKTDAGDTYRALAPVLASYGDILDSVEDGNVTRRAVTAIVSGNRPQELMEAESIRHAGIDGRLSDLDSEKPAHLMPLISDHWGRNFAWRGDGAISPEERETLRGIIEKVHGKGRRVRFWATPEVPALWEELYAAGVDYINTDDLCGLEEFLLRKTAEF